MSKRRVINKRFELEDLPVGMGGMGEVWFGRDAKLDRDVAVKLVRFPGGVPDPDLVRRFDREARIMARLAHPGVPAVYDAGIHEGRPYLVMQRVRGVSLQDLIAEQGSLSIGWTAGIAAQICSVLTVAHEASLVHRDLKPGNVMLDSEGGVKVIDFGLATGPSLADFSTITRSGEPIGTAAYMAPEQVMAAVSTPQTDLYALGCIVHEAITGEPVFRGATSYSLMSQQVNDVPAPLRGVRADVPIELEELVLALLEKKPEDRPATAEIVYQRLLPFATELGPLPGAINRPSQPSASRMYARALSRVLADAAQPTATAARAPATAARGAVTRRSGMGRGDLDRLRDDAADLAQQSRFSQAAELVAQAVPAATRSFGAGDRDVVRLRLELANLRFEGGDYRSAAPEYRRLAEDLASHDGAESELVLQCRMKEATCHALIGETGLALRQLDGLLADESRVFGGDDPRTVEIRRQIALLQLGAGERDAARTALETLRSDLTRLHGPGDSSVTEIDFLLGRLAKRPSR